MSTLSSLFRPDSPEEMPAWLSRRRFLIRGGQALAALVLAPQLAGCGSSDEAFVFTDPDRPGFSYQALAAELEGPLLLPGQPGYAQAALPQNLRYADRLPAAIARCASVADIANSLAFAQANGVPFVVRSGGHSYSGFSTTSGLMIDVSQMKSVAYDGASGRVTLGPGAQNQTVYNNLRPLSRAVTHGRCSTVGVAGLVLGGGIGFNMRLHGLTIDQLVQTDILLADGSILTLSPEQNADLFWACRGAGGGNFGIHTSFTFQTYEVGNVTFFRIDWRNNLDTVLPALMEAMAAAPREFGVKLNISALPGPTGNQLTLEMLGQLVGSPEQLAEILAPAYAAGAPSSEDIQTLPYWDAQMKLGVEASTGYSYERSHYAHAPLTSQGSAVILRRLREWPGLHGSADWKIFLTGGRVADYAPDATAYVHRQAFGISSVELEWEDDVSLAELEPNLDWVDQFHQEMEPYTSDYSYQNFIDANQRNYLHAYYGSNLPRLVQVKAKYDPFNVFNYPQSIPVSL
jgi:FAD/FMN-containing dehydrogenase